MSFIYHAEHSWLELNSALNHRILLVKHTFFQDCSTLLSAECGHFWFGKLISVRAAHEYSPHLNAENYKLDVVFSVTAFIVEVQTMFSKNEFNTVALQLEGCFTAAEKGDKI